MDKLTHNARIAKEKAIPNKDILLFSKEDIKDAFLAGVMTEHNNFGSDKVRFNEWFNENYSL